LCAVVVAGADTLAFLVASELAGGAGLIGEPLMIALAGWAL
jgi:hypothetical protein